MKFKLVLVALLLVVASVASAQGPPDGRGNQRPDGAGPPDDNGRPDEVGRDRVESTPRGFAVRPADAGRPEFSYDSQSARINLHQGSQQVLDVLVDSVFEFQDDNGDGAYQVGETVLQRFELDSLDSRVVSTNETIRDAVYDLPDNGVFQLRFYAGADTKGTKFDVIITDFPFQFNDTHLGVTSRAVGLAGLQADSIDDHAGIRASGSGEQPFMTWTDDVLINGEPSTVQTTVQIDSANGAVVTWAYAHGDVVHDPLIGTAFITLENLGQWAPFIFALGGSMALVSLGLVLRRGNPW